MKQCRRCQKMYEPTAHQLRKHDFICPPCNRATQKEWRAARKTSGNPVISTRMPREYHAVYEKAYFQDPKNRARAANNQRRYRNDPNLRERHLARWTVNHAIASGKIIRGSCEICGDDKTEAHHDDYSKPLEVRWLCKKHHQMFHAKAQGE